MWFYRNNKCGIHVAKVMTHGPVSSLSGRKHPPWPGHAFFSSSMSGPLHAAMRFYQQPFINNICKPAPAYSFAARN